MYPYEMSLETFNDPRINVPILKSLEIFLMILVSFPIGKTSGNICNPRINDPIRKKSGNLFNDPRINKSAHTKKVLKHLMILISMRLY